MDKYMILCLELLITNLILLLTIINVHNQSKRIAKVSERYFDLYKGLDEAFDSRSTDLFDKIEKLSTRIDKLENGKKDVKKTNKKERSDNNDNTK